MGIERKMKVLDCPRSLGNHFIHSQLSSPLSRGATWLRNDGQPVHSGCQRRPGSDPEPSKSIQHLMYTEDPSWASLAVAGACCSRHAELPLRWPADHGWLTPTFSSSHSRKAQRLVHTPSGPRYYGPTWEPKSESQYLFNIYIHAYTLISSTPLFPLPTTFPPTSCCFF